MENQYIYLMLEESETAFGEYETDVVYASTNVNDFLVALVNAPRCSDLTLQIIDNGRININNDQRLTMRYSHYSHMNQRLSLQSFADVVFGCKSIHIDVRNTIINYINDYINKTDFVKKDNEYITRVELE